MATRQVGESPALAPILLNHWLDNRDPDSTFTFAAPPHLIQSSYVTAVLREHRGIFLSQREVASGGIRGAITRLRSGVWDLSNRLELTYHSLVSVGDTLFDLVRIQRSGTDAERDLLTALRGFQLHSEVWLQGTETSRSPRRVQVRITWWMAHITDRYDWDYGEHFTVPNPDFGRTEPDAVRPRDRELTVYHRNAQRLERAGLAAPYNVRSSSWHVPSDIHTGTPVILQP